LLFTAIFLTPFLVYSFADVALAFFPTNVSAVVAICVSASYSLIPTNSEALPIVGNVTRLSVSYEVGRGGFFLKLDLAVRAKTSRSVLRPLSIMSSCFAKSVAV
jgi:hypothetical protein